MSYPANRSCTQLFPQTLSFCETTVCFCPQCSAVGGFFHVCPSNVFPKSLMQNLSTSREEPPLGLGRLLAYPEMDSAVMQLKEENYLNYLKLTSSLKRCFIPFHWSQMESSRWLHNNKKSLWQVIFGGVFFGTHNLTKNRQAVIIISSILNFKFCPSSLVWDSVTFSYLFSSLNTHCIRNYVATLAKYLEEKIPLCIDNLF